MRKLLISAMAFAVVLCGMNSCGKKENGSGQDWEKVPFEIQQGVNIGGWLSQTSSRKVSYEDFFNQADVRNLAHWGLDHIRLPIDEAEVFTESGEFRPHAIRLLHEVIGWCSDAEMRVVLDFHILRSHYFNDAKGMTLWKDAREQDKFIRMWKMLAKEFGHYPNGLLAYELLNEVSAPDAEVWNDLLMRLYGAIRKMEPERMLVISPIDHSSIDALEKLRIPQNDPNIMLSIHFYTPHLLTHYQAPWWKALRNLEIQLHYPGQLVTQVDIDTIQDEENLRVVNYYNSYYDKEVFKKRLQKALDITGKTGLKVYVVEFGCINNTDKELKYRWLKDVTDLFKENNMPYAIWGYKFGFGILDMNGKPIDERIMKLFSCR